MKDMYILKIAEKTNNQLNEQFLGNTVSKGKIVKNREIEISKDEGILLIKETIPYIENIYNNANRLIINEEEIVNVELAKKITAESVKHLSKHTNFIQSINEAGDVEPSKILNINKEETEETYENKLVYFLIQNIKLYIKQKKEYLEKKVVGSKQQKEKTVEYMSSTNIEGKEMSLSLNVNTVLDNKGIKKTIDAELAAIDAIEESITILTRYPTYQLFEKKRLRPLTPPIKKTNLILKNTNFHYVIKLWDYLQENLVKEIKNEESYVKIEDNPKLKKMFDEMSYLYYIGIEDFDKEQTEERINDAKRRFLNATLEFLELPNKEVEKLFVDKKKKDKIADSEVNKEIKNIFDKYVHEYLKQIQK